MANIRAVGMYDHVLIQRVSAADPMRLRGLTRPFHDVEGDVPAHIAGFLALHTWDAPKGDAGKHLDFTWVSALADTVSVYFRVPADFAFVALMWKVRAYFHLDPFRVVGGNQAVGFGDLDGKKVYTGRHPRGKRLGVDELQPLVSSFADALVPDLDPQIAALFDLGRDWRIPDGISAVIDEDGHLYFAGMCAP